MTRAIPVPDEFDPIPSLGTIESIDVRVDDAASDAGLRAVLVRADSGMPDPFDAASLRSAGFTAEPGQTHLLAGAPPMVLVGVGSGAVDLNAARGAGAAIASSLPSASGLSIDLGSVEASPEVVRGLVEGVILARYSWDALRREPSKTQVGAITIVTAGGATEVLIDAARRGHLEALAHCVSRDLANCPPAHLTAVRWAAVAERIGPQRGLSVETHDRAWLLEERCGGVIAVNGGSDEEPRLITLEYQPDASVANGRHVALVGKGLTYDSGGLAIKPGDAVHAMMKNDMSGGGAVFAAMLVLKQLAVPSRVTAYIMCTDNMPSGSAMKMGDVITHRDGTTVEVLNTDAEGRLVMADALVLASELQPDAIIDIATLTGACMRALGTEIAGVMGTDQELVDLLRAAGETTAEPLWQLPMGAHFREELDSDVADMKNLGLADAGASSAAEFLAHFVHGVPFAHIDIAGVAAVAKPAGWKTRGMSGFGARLLVEALERFPAQV
ncbi:MAG: leucyl aminopeptidase [Ilumatobacteraceae bacterium]|nr:MAG: leucyl aminopeptidase [Actinomycetota bacterium]